MAQRTPKEIEAWAFLLELCKDDVQVFDTSADMRRAVIEVERDMERLHAIEALAAEVFQLLEQLAQEQDDCDLMDHFWTNEPKWREQFKALLPQAFRNEYSEDKQ